MSVASSKRVRPTRGRLAVGLGSLIAVAAVAWPAIDPTPGDGFPLSDYPMFASSRDREAVFFTAVGINPDGDIVRLEPRLIAGTDEPVLATETVRNAIASDTTEELCVEIADRLQGRPDLTRVEVTTETYDAVAWFEGDEGDRLHVTRTVYSRCPT